MRILGVWLVPFLLGATGLGTVQTTEPQGGASQPRQVLLGVHVPGSQQILQANLGDFVAGTGREPDVVHIFTDWNPKPFPATNVATITSHGAIPLVTWEPWIWTDEKAIADPLGRILDGVDDSYITAWAEAAEAYGKPLYLRFAHEMNGNWYPWGRSSVNTPAKYVAAYRHVHDLFVAAGADNVSWVWSPNSIDSPNLEAKAYYPDDEYVDVVGVDGYNWGTERSDTRWRSFNTIFSTTIDSIRAYADAPVWITETGSTELGGSKADWITDMFTTVAEDDRYSAIIYFDSVGTGNWPLTTSDAATAAYRAGTDDLLAKVAGAADELDESVTTMAPELEQPEGLDEVPAAPTGTTAADASPVQRESAVSPTPTASPAPPPVPAKPAPALRPTLKVRPQAAHTRRKRAVLLTGVAGVQPVVTVQRKVGARWMSLRTVRTSGGAYRAKVNVPRQRLVLRAVAGGLTSASVSVRVR